MSLSAKSTIMSFMTDTVKSIEDMSLNAWPSSQVQYYDGWVLRYSGFYTHRTNCVEQLGVSCLPLEEKIRFCENIYRRWRTPCIFKISPVGDPALDGLLAERGYAIEHLTTVMTASLMNVPAFVPAHPLRIEPRVTPQWIDGLFRLKHMDDPFFRRIVPRMYDAIPMDEIAVSLTEDGCITALGLGILDRDAVGIYAIHVAEHRRRSGIGREIVSTLLREASSRGSVRAYLQVVTDNAPAQALYRGCGFREEYCCWYRCKEV